MKILICDDSQERCREAYESIDALHLRDEDGSEIHIDQLFDVDGDLEEEKYFTNALSSLFEAISFGPGQLPNASPFHGCDLVILDNNLSALNISGARLTAESIAGYIRAHSPASYIVSLNKNPNVDFDLRYLVGDYSTVADLAINTKHLANRALWTGNINDATSGFKPWYWPALLLEPKRRNRQVEFVKQRLDKSIFQELEFDPSLSNYLSRHAIGFLSTQATYQTDRKSKAFSPSEVTFVGFFLDRGRSLPIEDRYKLSGLDSDSVSGHSDSVQVNVSGLAPENRETIARCIAADIDIWFRRDLLAPQDALVDLPHLLLRMPFLLEQRADTLDTWNEIANGPDPTSKLASTAFNDVAVPAALSNALWCPNPTYFWPKVRDAPYRSRFLRQSSSEPADVVFCEDVSAFRLRHPEQQSAPKQFEAEFEGSWSRRYVAYIDSMNYAPMSRFSL